MQFYDYRSFFRRATGLNEDPYSYQEYLAIHGPFPELLNVPTGMGKTAAIVLAWLWMRLNGPADTPRRLVWCLPMRVLVEQTSHRIEEWLKNLDMHEDIRVHMLLGGEEVQDWDLCPELPAILVGTQDMLISRAINRGYGMSRYRWPMHFGLLNNDCQWVLDEVQLMGAGVATTAQFHAFRKSFGTFGNCRSLWMSATLHPKWLETVDLGPSALGEPLRLNDKDRSRSKTYKAIKPLRKSTTFVGDTGALANEILDAHQLASRTLVIVNTVARAVQLFKKLEDKSSKRKMKEHIALIHSRFRPQDRAEKVQQLLSEPPPEGSVIVSTQVVEAGVDVSARTLFTELAPWASLVQRFGRCNRRGEFDSNLPAQIYWIDLPQEKKQQDKLAPPYDVDALNASKKLLENCKNDVGPAVLDGLDAELEFKHGHVIRRKDLIELFDTTPDLAGNDIDIDRYVRDIDSSDVQVFWRDLSAAPSDDEPLPQRNELCPAPISEFKSFLGKLANSGELKKRGIYGAFRRNFLERRWEPVRERQVYPGQMYMLPCAAGGYDPVLGWTGDVARKAPSAVEIIPYEGRRIDTDSSNDAEPYSQIGVWQKLSIHSSEAFEELRVILDSLSELNAFSEPLLTAIRWHDLGKVHWVFRHALPDDNTRDPFEVYAKAKGKWKRYLRPHFRHELASALAVLQEAEGRIPEHYRNLIAYLVAAHHGKVRLSIRSLPGENRPNDRGVRFARGVWDGDELPETDLGDGVVTPQVTLSLESMELGLSAAGEPSWVERMLGLRDDPKLGPFRLAYLESLLRAADMRVSARIAKDET